MESSESNTYHEQGQHIVEAKRARADLNFFLYVDDTWNWQKLNNVFMSYYPRADKFGYIKLVRNKLDEYLNAGLDFTSDLLRDFFRTSTIEATNVKMADMDDYSKIAFMGVGYNFTGTKMDFKYLMNSDFFIDNITGGGKFGFISGTESAALGVGKTDFALRLIEMLLFFEECVVTNIEVEVDHPNFKRCITLKQAIRQSIINLINGKTTMMILDEVPQFLVKERGTSKQNVNMNNLQYLFRKMGISLIVIAQLQKKVPTNISDMAVWHIQKLSLTEMVFTKKVNGYDEYHWIKNVQRTNLKFITGESASFRAEFEVGDMHDYIVTQEEQNLNNPGKYGGRSQLQVILDYIDTDTKKITEADLKTATKVMYLHAKMTQRDIAMVVGKSQGTVSNWLKGMAIPLRTEEPAL